MTGIPTDPRPASAPGVRAASDDARAKAEKETAEPSSPTAGAPAGGAMPADSPERQSAPPVADFRRPRRFPYWFVTLGIRFVVGCYLRVRVEGREHLPAGPALIAFTHSNWLDPFVLVAALPGRPDLVYVGPKEEDMRVGARNRLIAWSGRGIPFKPARSDLREVTRSLQAALDTGVHVAIAPEGRIHAGERSLLPLSPGAAWFALRTGVPVVPVGITGLGWVRFGRTVRVRIGPALQPSGKPTRAAVEALSTELRAALLHLVSHGRDERPPGPIGRWITELFNDWPEGGRPETPD